LIVKANGAGSVPDNAAALARAKDVSTGGGAMLSPPPAEDVEAVRKLCRAASA
jgi:hypothetical protein